MTEMTAVEQAESHLRAHAEAVTVPGAAECLACYMARMLQGYGCDTTLRWAQRFRDLRSPRATGLEERLGRLGGYCDCELFMNGIQLARHQLVRDLATDELEQPSELPDCAGVRPTSTRWCTNWERLVGW
ncbi:hypothetical protein GCM10009844_14430 [Nocardioides koreensis]|uniref:DUF2695 domain-containing protein n=1 Tax=Nocardioides koreensis TaxID=433651 RepID=A0ABP5LAI3_9ACTN